MQRDENSVYINNGVNRQQIDAIHMGYGQTGAVYTRRSGSVQIQPDRPPISVRTRIGSNSTTYTEWHNGTMDQPSNLHFNGLQVRIPVKIQHCNCPQQRLLNRTLFVMWTLA